jgi:hypothetical protein
MDTAFGIRYGVEIVLSFSFLFLLDTRIGFAENFIKESGVPSTE